MDKTIIVWKTPTCVQCPKIFKMLDDHNVPYQIEDITTPENEKQFDYFTNTLGIKQAPIVEYSDHVFSGFFYGEVMGLIKQYKTDHQLS